MDIPVCNCNSHNIAFLSSQHKEVIILGLKSNTVAKNCSFFQLLQLKLETINFKAY